MLDFKISSEDSLSKIITEKGITSWSELITYVKNIPYGRNSNRIDNTLVITENKGTCSSKHSLLKRIADLNGMNDIKLIIGIYKMNATNTPKIGNVILNNDLKYIPEAHCYLRYNDETIDATSNSSDFGRIINDVIIEKNIQPNQVGSYKIKYHQAFIKEWIVSEKLNFSFEEIWKIREQCIENLSSQSKNSTNI
ncbi:hypothetical protein [uncultured Aquimarina sp.]|uniref:hypothetical protein n=1 Tax=uncultured Aquimarina sp. TaxID=575652 RepID=UPI00261938EF|nr:hypothetical protein [uncultured Aquimarina sp.]